MRTSQETHLVWLGAAVDELKAIPDEFLGHTVESNVSAHELLGAGGWLRTQRAP